ncbi:MAG: hypothetical protein GY763_15100 [Gammaproteobacteria bacterium]|nr:hypothetical protein [Gammaproteobacteria bacterium]
MAHQVDLVLPGLFNLSEFYDGAELPALNSLLRFGQPVANDLFNIDAILKDCLGVGHLGFASAFAEGKDAGHGREVLCRAVHLKPDMGNAMAMPLDQYCDDIGLIINDLSDYFKEDSDFDDLGDGLWMMRLKQIQPAIEFPHYLSIMGNKLDQSIATLSWSKLMNEMQMFMHAHPINQQRLQNGQLAINSLWCWGAGEYLTPQRLHAAWYCDDLELKTYGRKAGVDCLPLKTLVDKGVVGNTLIVELELLRDLKSSQNTDLSALLEDLEYHLFKPLFKAVKAGQINLRLRTGYEFDFLLSRASTFRFWRKPRALTDLT